MSRLGSALEPWQTNMRKTCVWNQQKHRCFYNSPDFGLWQVQLPPTKNAGLPRLTLMRDATVMFLWVTLVMPRDKPVAVTFKAPKKHGRSMKILEMKPSSSSHKAPSLEIYKATLRIKLDLVTCTQIYWPSRNQMWQLIFHHLYG